jgi:hypothetical protein
MVEETGVPRENHRPVASHWQISSHKVVSSTSELDSNSKREWLLFNIKWAISWWEHVDDRGLCGRDRMVQLDLQLSMQSVPITTHVLSVSPIQWWIQRDPSVFPDNFKHRCLRKTKTYVDNSLVTPAIHEIIQWHIIIFKKQDFLNSIRMWKRRGPFGSTTEWVIQKMYTFEQKRDSNSGLNFLRFNRSPTIT